MHRRPAASLSRTPRDAHAPRLTFGRRRSAPGSLFAEPLDQSRTPLVEEGVLYQKEKNTPSIISRIPSYSAKLIVFAFFFFVFWASGQQCSSSARVTTKLLNMGKAERSERRPRSIYELFNRGESEWTLFSQPARLETCGLNENSVAAWWKTWMGK